MTNPGGKGPTSPEGKIGKGVHAQELEDRKNAPPSHVIVLNGVDSFLKDLDNPTHAEEEPVKIAVEIEEEVDITSLSGDDLLNFDFSARIEKLTAEMGKLGIDVSPTPARELVLVNDGFQIAS